ncbi:MAG: class I tRNA ligase family protein, partial [Anaerolineae bacterium]|nr:class I tRNA ligase family protein [Anaerolineae bacterium]
HQRGWSGHGLAVEVAVERALGPALANYDLARFNAACHASAVEGIEHGQALAERLGVWPDPADTYLTLDLPAIDKVWAALRRLWDAGQLRQELRVEPVCPRCATPLSAGEASRRSAEREATSAWLCLPWIADGQATDAYLLAWTPAAWTVFGLVALAVHPKAEYLLVELPMGRGYSPLRLLLAEAAVERALHGPYRLVRRLPGKALRGAHYRPLFTFLPASREINQVVLSESVPLDRGSGVVPLSPAFDPLSLQLAAAHKLPLLEPIEQGGRLNDAAGPWRGLAPLDAEPLLLEDLRTRGLLFREETETRSQALCPYCDTPLLTLARPVWLVGTWNVGRDRAWGVPLPVWACDRCGHEVCAGGLADLLVLTGRSGASHAAVDPSQLDPHRPAVDRLTFPCEQCGGTMRRLSPVLDAALEAAVLPWATSPEPGPADVAVGLSDRELGWLGDLTEMAALLRGSLAWGQAVTFSEGSVETGWDQRQPTPADALRWAAYTGTTPDQAEQGFLQPLWAWVYAQIDSQGTAEVTIAQPGAEERACGDPLRARLRQAVSTVTEALETCDLSRATCELTTLAGDLPGLYVAQPPDAEAIEMLSRLLAPFVPHLAEAIHQASGPTASVHLKGWLTVS